MTKYTIDQVAVNRWVASDGTRHVEADNEYEALRLLTLSDAAEVGGLYADAADAVDDMRTERDADSVCSIALDLIRMVTIHGDREPVEMTLQCLSNAVTRYLESLEANESD